MTQRQRYRAWFYGSLIGILSFTIFGWWQGSGGDALAIPGARLIAIGRLFGLVATVSILLEVFLMARLPFMEESFDLHEYIDLHRLTGYSVLLGIIGHVTFLTFGYAAPGHTGLWNQFWEFNTSYEDVLKATVGTAVFFGATLLSVKLIRSKMRYEYWYVTHLLMYGAILLTFLHQVKIGSDFINQPWYLAFWYSLYIGVFGLLGYYRFIRQIINWNKHRFVIQKIVPESDSVFSIYVTGRSVANYEYQPGQYATIRTLTANTWYEAHPYSFSSVPNQDYIRFSIATEGGDYSHKIQALKPGTKLLLDGPRGAFTASRANRKRVVLVAGGIGIAPYMSTIDGFLRSGKQVVLLYAMSKPEDLAFQSELEALIKRGLIIRAFASSRGTRLSPKIIHKLGTEDTIYLCGPERLTLPFKKQLLTLGHSSNDIVTEEFAY